MHDPKDTAPSLQPVTSILKSVSFLSANILAANKNNFFVNCWFNYSLSLFQFNFYLDE